MGIDSGLANIGWAVITMSTKDHTVTLADFGTVVTNNSKSLSDRLFFIQCEIHNLIKKYNPTDFCVEEYFSFGRGGGDRNGAHTSKAIGVILASIGCYMLPCELYAPQKMKKIVTGNGRADKDDVAEAIQKTFNNTVFKTNHASDAVGLALAYCREELGCQI